MLNFYWSVDFRKSEAVMPTKIMLKVMASDCMAVTSQPICGKKILQPIKNIITEREGFK